MFLFFALDAVVYDRSKATRSATLQERQDINGVLRLACFFPLLIVTTTIDILGKQWNHALQATLNYGCD